MTRGRTSCRWYAGRGLVKRRRLDIFFDTETSGRGTPDDPKRARIVALGAVAAGRRFYRLCNPGHAQNPRAVAVHGLSDERLARQQNFGELWTRFAAFARRLQRRFRRLRGEPPAALCLVGYNSSVCDVPNVLADLRREGRRPEELLLDARTRLVSVDFLPRLKHHKESVRRLHGLDSFKLADVHRALLGAEGAAHDALWDAQATRRVWRASRALRQLARRTPITAATSGDTAAASDRRR
jgi:DNA polymerase-3 subunit epsilon